MAQGLDATKPASGATLASLAMRTNFMALATCCKGPAAPSPYYDGLLWVDDVDAGNVKLKMWVRESNGGLGSWVVIIEHLEQAYPIFHGTTANFVHNQTVSSSAWTVTHNLGKYPSVTVVDDTKTVIPETNITSIQFTSVNQVVVHFPVGRTGQVYCN